MRKPNRTANVLRLAVAVIIATGLVFAPTTTDPAVSHATPALHRQTVAVDLTAAALTTAASATSDRSRAAVALPPVGIPTPQEVVATIGLIAIGAAWYTAFPVTLPLSFTAGVLFNVLVRGVSMQSITLDPVFILQASAAFFVAAPLFLGSPLLALTAKAVPTQTVSSSTAEQSTAARPARKAAGPGLAGSRRTAGAAITAVRAPKAHRAAPSAHKTPTDKKRSGSAGSARGGKKP
ncbi:hypothetical protein [Mycolicibacterium aichiense]|uniref:Transmembrane protein n=1 Tax=Mycolicibacterium aichiense TaxID=1799 RepID=A0AAD1HQH7_9MYCO|nr:hypothetical protein [Mycolicibacterium aichiense]MCV7016344.1 hypothetical protein [Mycolicibacterium aichiense]BBX09883.1 hypothetical protein MAIC_46860 [Mycolicibacterium aichiense]STZ26450.1 Uncharacterised protein [Mycolicibacterium aichiense]